MENGESFVCAFFLPADDLFETVSDRELRQIFEGQNRIHLEIKQLNRQLDMILDEQRRYVTAVTAEIAKRGAGFPGQQEQVSSSNKKKPLIAQSNSSSTIDLLFPEYVDLFLTPFSPPGFPAGD